jgi:hypothetical protein
MTTQGMTTQSTTQGTTPSSTTPIGTGTRDSAVGGASIIRRGIVAAGLLGIAAVHLADLPGKMSEVPYLGWAYIGLIVASLILAELVTTRSDRRLMAASAGLSAAVFIGFVINRTIGMPMATDDIGNWTEALGMVSLLIEATVIWVGTRAWLARD